jgi:catechol 2,3-dioxygenase-like lactoylglutathione lyase family enzyme
VPELNAIGIVASDTERSIAFYRLLGVEFPEGGEGHIEATLPNGVRFMLDAEEVIKSFRPDWARETGNQLALAFECDRPA